MRLSLCNSPVISNKISFRIYNSSQIGLESQVINGERIEWNIISSILEILRQTIVKKRNNIGMIDFSFQVVTISKA